MLEKLYQYRGKPPACGWVGSIVRHEAGHAAARNNRDAPLPPSDLKSNTVDASEVLYRQQLMRIVLEAIDELPPTYRQVVRLRDVDEHSVSEVASELHISRSNVAVRLHRAHKLLDAASCRCWAHTGADRTSVRHCRRSIVLTCITGPAAP